MIKYFKGKPNSGRTLEVIAHPDPRLSQKSVEIDLASELERAELDQLIVDLVATMRKENGAGLAAIQTGIPKCVFVYEDEDGKNELGAAALINPRIVHSSEEMVCDEEGCLSFPALYAPVERAQKVVVEGYNHTGDAVRVEAEDFLARVFQHEIDHLDGVTFIAHLPDEDKKLALREYFDLRAL